MADFYERLLDRVGQLPGIQAATLTSALPANPVRLSPFLAEGQPVVPVAERPIAIVQALLGAYCPTLRVPLVRGRPFQTRDRADSPQVAIVNQTFAR